MPVGPDSGGGAEQVLYLVERGLVQAGCKSIVIAAPGSTVSGSLIEAAAATGEITDEVRAFAQERHLRSIEESLEREPVDLIHFHGLDFHTYVPKRSVPMLATLHLPLAWYQSEAFEVSQVQVNYVSQSQAAGRSPVILNGVDVDRYHVGLGSREYLLWLGRVCPEKGVHIALRVAHRLDLPLIVAGPVHPFSYHQSYFREQVQPLLDSEREYVGPVGLPKKVELLANARCLLVPSLAPETSSLVAMEALSSGTPVVAFDSGALPEIIEHGETGFIVRSEEEMAEAVTHVGEIPPETCRARAQVRFDSKRMVSDYLNLYRDICGSQ